MPIQKATAVNSAQPDAEAARVKKLMASRPTLNPNQRRVPRQDLSGAVNGVLTGRGGNRQTLGTAAMRRLSAAGTPLSAAMQKEPDFQGASDYLNSVGAGRVPGVESPAAPPPGFADKVGRMAQPMEMPGGASGIPEIPRVEMSDEQRAQSAASPAPLMQAYGISQGGPGGGAAPPGMAAGLEGALMGGTAPGMQPGLPPAIMQRLNALRHPAPQGGAGQAPAMRGSFADFWARNGQGMTPY